MIPIDDFKEIMHRIISSSVSKNEYEQFLFEENLIDDIYLKDLGIQAEDQKEKGYEFGKPVVEALEFVSLIIGTFKTLYDLYQIYKNNKKEEEIKEMLKGTWKISLVEAGLSEEKAEIITQKFKDDLLEKIEKNAF